MYEKTGGCHRSHGRRPIGPAGDGAGAGAGSQSERTGRRSDDPVRLYLREVGTVPRLTPGQELELAARICDAARQSASDEARPDGSGAISAPIGAEEARRRLAEGNLRLVVGVARRYAGLGVPLADLIQEGNLGLLRATETFDPSRGCRFSTYATVWIRHAVLQALADQARTIRIPESAAVILRRAYRAAARLRQALGREATTEELATAVGLQEEPLVSLLGRSKKPVPLEIPAGAEDGPQVLDVVEDPAGTAQETAAAHSLLHDRICDALAALEDVERRVILLRFGIEDGRSRTLEEVAGNLGMSRERVRQTEGKALRKLRRSRLCQALRACAGGE